MLRLPGQKSIHSFEVLYPGTSIYHHTIAFEISGPLNVEEFIIALKNVVNRHSVLRSNIIQNKNNETSLQVSCSYHANEKTLPFEKIELPENFADAAIENLTQTLEEIEKADLLNQPFNFEQEPLWRGALLKLTNTKYQFLLVVHHLIIDITSQNIILRDLSEYYNAQMQDRVPNLPSLPQFADIDFNEDENTKIDYWKEKLANLNLVDFQPYATTTNQPRFSGDRVTFNLNAELIKKINIFADENRCSINQALLTLVYILILRYTNETDICLGIASANRRGYKINVDNMVNCFMNTIPIRLTIEKNDTFKDLLIKVSHHLIESLANQLPIGKILQYCLDKQTKIQLSSASPFNILCNFTKKNTLELIDCNASPVIELNLHHSIFKNFGINFNENPDGSFSCYIEYNTNIFKKDVIERFIIHFEKLAKEVVKHPDLSIDTLSLMTKNEKDLLNNFHNNFKPPVTPLFIHQIFSQIANETPNKTAVMFHDEKGNTDSITYGELEKRSNQLAAYLMQQLNIDKYQTVGISVTRSINLMVVVLAVLKTGAIIVPLEVKLDVDLINSPTATKISDTLTSIIIVDNNTESLYTTINKKTYLFNIENQAIRKQLRDQHYISPVFEPKDLVYIMYTSGTTGKPKGVKIEHSGLANLYLSLLDRKLKPDSKVLCTAPLTFDAWFFEILEWLAVKGELHYICEKDRLNPETQLRVMRDFKINCATLTPGSLKELDPDLLPDLIDIISMGSVPDIDSLLKWYHAGRTIRNEYGPTENTICSTVNPWNPDKTYINIGEPIPNTDIFILNTNQDECPLDVPGEIFLTGNNLSSGYVGDEVLSRKKFPILIQNHRNSFFSLNENDVSYGIDSKDEFSKAKRKLDFELSKLPKKQKNTSNLFTIKNNIQKGQRFYKTGDKGRYTLSSTGKISIEFSGRVDRQVKLNGIRIEIEGIEATLKKHPNIHDIHIKENPIKKGSFTAYIVTKNKDKIDKKIIDEFLRNQGVVPIAWPRTFVFLEKIPLNKNGKIDSKALPDPIEEQIKDCNITSSRYQQLRQIWAKVLNCNPEDIDINANFFIQGGDSLSLIKLHHMIKNDLSLNIDFYTLGTLSILQIDHIYSQSHDFYSAIENVGACGDDEYNSDDNNYIFDTLPFKIM